MAPPKHVLERRGITQEDWDKGYRSKAQKEAAEKGGAAPAATAKPAELRKTEAEAPKKP